MRKIYPYTKSFISIQFNSQNCERGKIPKFLILLLISFSPRRRSNVCEMGTNRVEGTKRLIPGCRSVFSRCTSFHGSKRIGGAQRENYCDTGTRGLVTRKHRDTPFHKSRPSSINNAEGSWCGLAARYRPAR